MAPDERTRRHNHPRTPVRELFLKVMAVFALVLLATGLLVEWPFWSLWLRGRRADATVTHTTKRIYGGRPRTLVFTDVHYLFTDEAGEPQVGYVTVSAGSVFLAEGSGQWQGGESLPVMYERSDPSTNMPAALSFYWSEDSAWFLMLVLDVGGLVGFAGCLYAARWLRDRRLRRWRFLQTASSVDMSASAKRQEEEAPPLSLDLDGTDADYARLVAEEKQRRRRMSWLDTVGIIVLIALPLLLVLALVIASLVYQLSD